jgi:RNA polymerase sigma-70 factor (ECF subfamily)
MTEKELVLGCLLNKRTHQKEFFNQYSKKVNAIIIRYCGANDEIILDVFKHVFNNFKLINEDKPVMDWLRVFVATYCVNYIKYDKQIELSNQGLNVSDDMVKNVSLSGKEMVEMINQLPLVQKLVFNLFVVEDLTIEEVSSLLEFDVDDINQELTNARENLKKLLEN